MPQPLQELMADPVMVATGHTYDRVCIERWLAQVCSTAFDGYFVLFF